MISMDTNGQGMLFLCATPIGNLSDVTPRVLETLKDADIIAAEDTRNSLKLLNHFDIHTKLTSYHEYNKYDKADELITLMLNGQNVALITDAGTPGISDPGEVLVRKCQEVGIRVSSLPGACALITALTMSGLATRRFVFEGFLSSDKKEREETLKSLKDETRTIIIYEAPHHLRKTIDELMSVFGEDRKVAFCRELTKQFEEVKHMTLREAKSHYEKKEPRGEYVLVIEGENKEKLIKDEIDFWKTLSVAEHMEYYEKLGYDNKEAMKLVAKDRGVSKRDIYKEIIDNE